MIPDEYQAVIVRLARMGRADAVAVVERAMAQGIAPMAVLLEALDYMLARLRPLPLHVAAPRGEAVPYQPIAQVRAPEPAVARPAPIAEVAKHGADDADKRAALRKHIAQQPPAVIADDSAPITPEQAAPEPCPIEQAEPEPDADKPVLQLPTVANGGQLYLDAVAALASLGYAKAECRRMAKTAIEYGASSLDAVIRACTKRA